MQFPRPLAGLILSSFFPLSLVLSAGAITAEPVPIAFSQNEPPLLDIGRSTSRILPLVVDFAGILHIEGGMSAIAVGNPDIADASLADHRTVILTGRMSGTTNLIALDDAGRVLADVTLRVTSQKPGMVTVRRGTQIQAYTCGSGFCDRATNEPESDVPLVAGADG